MTKVGRRYRRVVSAVVVVPFALLWLTEFVTEERPEGGVLAPAILLGVVAIPWVFAVRLLWGKWWEQTTEGRFEIDGPEWLLSVSLALLPDGRGEWAEAMTAELAEVQGRSACWWFALGGARTAMFPPNHRSLARLSVVAFLGVVALRAIVGGVLPPLQLFSVALATLFAPGYSLLLADPRDRAPMLQS